MSSRRSQNKLTSRAGRTIADLRDDDRCELIDGTLYELPMTSFEHGHIASLIVMAIGPAYQLGKGGPGGWWIQGENDFAVNGHEVFRPDALGWRKERLPRMGKGKRVVMLFDVLGEQVSEMALAKRNHAIEAFGLHG